jgi:large subunit ribosomal protein L32
MALPKRKYAKARQGKRRSHLAKTPPATELCPQCHTIKKCHHVCPNCGYYGGSEVIEVKGPKK